MLRFDVLAGVAWRMRGLREGRETTITAVHISAVHHVSAIMLVRERRRWKMSGKSTARRIVDAVIRCTVCNETGETDDDCNHAQREDTD